MNDLALTLVNRLETLACTLMRANDEIVKLKADNFSRENEIADLNSALDMANTALTSSQNEVTNLRKQVGVIAGRNVENDMPPIELRLAQIAERMNEREAIVRWMRTKLRDGDNALTDIATAIEHGAHR